MEQVLFFYDLDVFGGIRSTQPTMLSKTAAQGHSILRKYWVSRLFSRGFRFGWNARRIWASTPQNREEIRRNPQKHPIKDPYQRPLSKTQAKTLPGLGMEI